jgi:hypothetical protein
MPYTLWSRGRLLGHTELDITCVQDHVRMGFIDPTPDGKRLLPDATGVPAAAHALARAARRAAHKREATLTEYADFVAACDRREALGLELRDEAGAPFRCEWIQINDTDDHSSADDDDDLYDDEPLDPELEAAIEHNPESIESFFDGEDYDRVSSWEPPDERWDTTKYFMMVHLNEDT